MGADDGYVVEDPQYVKSSKGLWNHKDAEVIQSRCKNRQETVNKRFKYWSIVHHLYHHEIHNHRYIFQAIYIILKMAINNGESLFDCGASL